MNHDKLYDRIKDAASKSEQRDFAAMDKVWNRVEEKLDTKALTNQNRIYKIIAVAASILLLTTLGFYFSQSATDSKIPNNETIVVSDSILPAKTVIPDNAIAAEKANPIIKTEAPEILREQLVKPSAIVSNAEVAEVELPITSQAAVQKSKETLLQKSASAATRIFEARAVQRETGDVELAFEKPSEKEKLNPLLIIDGERVAEGKRYDKSLKKALSNTDESNDIVILKEPLYIINGTYYSETELFGPEPTSPYAPLNSQKIETLTILQGDQATAIYGEKGRKGVVIITTKGGKPAAGENGK